MLSSPSLSDLQTIPSGVTGNHLSLPGAINRRTDEMHSLISQLPKECSAVDTRRICFLSSFCEFYGCLRMNPVGARYMTPVGNFVRTSCQDLLSNDDLETVSELGTRSIGCRRVQTAIIRYGRNERKFGPYRCSLTLLLETRCCLLLFDVMPPNDCSRLVHLSMPA